MGKGHKKPLCGPGAGEGQISGSAWEGTWSSSPSPPPPPVRGPPRRRRWGWPAGRPRRRPPPSRPPPGPSPALPVRPCPCPRRSQRSVGVVQEPPWSGWRTGEGGGRRSPGTDQLVATGENGGEEGIFIHFGDGGQGRGGRVRVVWVNFIHGFHLPQRDRRSSSQPRPRRWPACPPSLGRRPTPDRPFFWSDRRPDRGPPPQPSPTNWSSPSISSLGPVLPPSPRPRPTGCTATGLPLPRPSAPKSSGPCGRTNWLPNLSPPPACLPARPILPPPSLAPPVPSRPPTNWSCPLGLPSPVPFRTNQLVASLCPPSRPVRPSHPQPTGRPLPVRTAGPPPRPKGRISPSPPVAVRDQLVPSPVPTLANWSLGSPRTGRSPVHPANWSLTVRTVPSCPRPSTAAGPCPCPRPPLPSPDDQLVRPCQGWPTGRPFPAPVRGQLVARSRPLPRRPSHPR